jgi:hypothetical protein
MRSMKSLVEKAAKICGTPHVPRMLRRNNSQLPVSAEVTGQG